jgi:hypothetical protein
MRLEAYLAEELARPVRADARAMAGALARDTPKIAAVLFYGSCLRDPDSVGLLDFYVLVDGPDEVLPPNVTFIAADAPTNLGAKVATISRRQFMARLGRSSLDTTLWARFCQPAALVWCRDREAKAWVADALTAACTTAVWWAVALAPRDASPQECWTALFRATYGAELRAEGEDRARLIYASARTRFDTIMVLARAPAGAARSWRLRVVVGKLLNLVRLAKALATFEGGLDYVVWKIERHSGRKVELSAWQRRHPILASPSVLASLYRQGIIR